MKKKSILFILCMVIVVIASVISLNFVFGGKKENDSESNANTADSLVGTWIIAANYMNDKPNFNENQFVEFSNDKVFMYKDDLSSPYVESVYDLDSSNQLNLSDISSNYIVALKTNNCIRLYDTKDSYMLLIRNNVKDIEKTLVTEDDLQGKWNIVLKAETINNGEVMVFNGDNLDYYKDAAEQPVASTKFVMKDGMLVADSLGMMLKCYKTGDNHMIFVDQDGIVWELSK